MMKQIVLAAAIIALPLGGAFAATITNTDDAAQTIVVSEGGNKTDITLASKESTNVCAGGCFVTFPNGDREALAGDEKIDIVGGAANFK